MANDVQPPSLCLRKTARGRQAVQNTDSPECVQFLHSAQWDYISDYIKII